MLQVLQHPRRRFYWTAITHIKRSKRNMKRSQTKSMMRSLCRKRDCKKVEILVHNVFLSYPRAESSSDCSSTCRRKHFLREVSTKEWVVTSELVGRYRPVQCLIFESVCWLSQTRQCNLIVIVHDNFMFPLFDCWIFYSAEVKSWRCNDREPGRGVKDLVTWVRSCKGRVLPTYTRYGV